MAGCGCYQTLAREASRKIRLLKSDKIKFNTVMTKVSNCSSSIDSSVTFFENLGAALDKIVINQKKFDDGQCRRTAADIGKVNSEIESVVGQIKAGIDIIDKAIQDQQKIVNRVFYCDSCLARDAAAKKGTSVYVTTE